MHGTGAPLGKYTSAAPPDAMQQAHAVGAVIARSRRVLVVGHIGADGDVCGSSLALACALREMGKDVVVYNQEPYPETYRWLPGGDDVKTSLNRATHFDATLVVDAARPDRLGADFPDAAHRGTYVWIDHHRLDAPPGDLAFIDLTSAAVGEQVAMILDAMGHALSPAVAMCIYASLLADTGGFRYQNSSARAFRLAARLVEAGVDPWAMTERIYESQAAPKVRLLGSMLSTLWLSPCGRVGVVEITRAQLAAAGAHDDDVQSLVNQVRSIKSVQLAVLLLQRDAGDTKVIIRSRGNVAVAPMAHALGASGHKNAASFVLETALAQAREHVVSAALDALVAHDTPVRAVKASKRRRAAGAHAPVGPAE